MRPIIMRRSGTLASSSRNCPDRREVFARLRTSDPNAVSFRPARNARLLRLHPTSRNSKEFIRQLSIEILLKQGVRSGGVTIHGFQNEMMDFPQGIRESGPLFTF